MATNERAERALRTSAEAYRLVEEARQMREERDAARAEVIGLRDVIGVVISGLEHTPIADLGEVQYAIRLLTEACSLGDSSDAEGNNLNSQEEGEVTHI
jgi:hypothetical protein